MLTTQLYFPGEAKNRSDSLFRKELLVRTAKNAGWLAGRFDFVVGYGAAGPSPAKREPISNDRFETPCGG